MEKFKDMRVAVKAGKEAGIDLHLKVKNKSICADYNIRRSRYDTI